MHLRLIAPQLGAICQIKRSDGHCRYLYWIFLPCLLVMWTPLLRLWRGGWMVCSSFTSRGKVSNVGFGSIFTRLKFLYNHGLVYCKTPLQFLKCQDFSKPWVWTIEPWVCLVPKQAVNLPLLYLTILYFFCVGTAGKSSVRCVIKWSKWLAGSLSHSTCALVAHTKYSF